MLQSRAPSEPPKWEPRAHAEIYVGRSPCHTGTVALVMNLTIGLTTPQFHVTFDDNFTTVPYLTSNTPPPNWLQLIRTSTEKVTDDEEKLSQKWLHPTENPTPPESHHNTTLVSNKSSTSIHPSPSPQGSKGEASSISQSPFVGLDNIGLRRSDRIAKNPF